MIINAINELGEGYTVLKIMFLNKVPNVLKCNNEKYKFLSVQISKYFFVAIL